MPRGFSAALRRRCLSFSVVPYGLFLHHDAPPYPVGPVLPPSGAPSRRFLVRPFVSCPAILPTPGKGHRQQHPLVLGCARFPVRPILPCPAILSAPGIGCCTLPSFSCLVAASLFRRFSAPGSLLCHFPARSARRFIRFFHPRLAIPSAPARPGRALSSYLAVVSANSSIRALPFPLPRSKPVLLFPAAGPRCSALSPGSCPFFRPRTKPFLPPIWPVMSQRPAHTLPRHPSAPYQGPARRAPAAFADRSSSALRRIWGIGIHPPRPRAVSSPFLPAGNAYIS